MISGPRNRSEMMISGPEIFIMTLQNSGPRNHHSGTISGPRNHHYDQENLYDVKMQMVMFKKPGKSALDVSMTMSRTSGENMMAGVHATSIVKDSDLLAASIII